MVIFLAALQPKPTSPGANPSAPLHPAVWQRKAGGMVVGDTSLCPGCQVDQVFLRWVEDFLSSCDPGRMVSSALVCSGGHFRKPTQVRARADKCQLGEVRGTSPRPSCQKKEAVESFVKEKTAPHELVQTGCLSSGTAAPWGFTPGHWAPTCCGQSQEAAI